MRWDLPDSTGKGGTTTTGNVARELLYNSNNRGIIVEQVPEQYRESFGRYGQSLATILRVLSCKEKVNVDIMKDFCTDLYLFLLKNFPPQDSKKKKTNTETWLSITPTLHKVLAHSWELIELNNGEGLASLDESGMEGCNKVLRRIRTNLSRKNSQESNLTDTIRRLWTESDPSVLSEKEKAKPFCNNCKERGHSKRYCPKLRELVGSTDDTLFNSIVDN